MKLSKTIVKRIEKTARDKRQDEGYNSDNRVFIQTGWSRKKNFHGEVIEIRIPSLKYSRRGYNSGRIRTVKAHELPIDTPEWVVLDYVRAVGIVLAEAIYKKSFRVYDSRDDDCYDNDKFTEYELEEDDELIVKGELENG